MNYIGNGISLCKCVYTSTNPLKIIYYKIARDISNDLRRFIKYFCFVSANPQKYRYRVEDGIRLEI